MDTTHPHAPTPDGTGTQPLPRLLRPRELANLLSVSLTTVWRLSRTPGFPRKFMISPNAVGYSEPEVRGWLAQRRVVEAGGGQ